jgi:hypothetical protein
VWQQCSGLDGSRLDAGKGTREREREPTLPPHGPPPPRVAQCNGLSARRPWRAPGRPDWRRRSAAALAAMGPPARVRTLLIDNYDSYTYNLFQMLTEVNAGACRVCVCGCHAALVSSRRRQGVAPRA